MIKWRRISKGLKHYILVVECPVALYSLRIFSPLCNNIIKKTRNKHLGSVRDRVNESSVSSRFASRLNPSPSTRCLAARTHSNKTTVGSAGCLV